MFYNKKKKLYFKAKSLMQKAVQIKQRLPQVLTTGYTCIKNYSPGKI